MATAKQLPNGNWKIQIYLGVDKRTGKPINKYITAATKKEAEKKALECRIGWELEKNKREHPVQYLTVQEAMEEYLAIKSNILSPSTLSGYRGIIRCYFTDIKQLHLEDLTNTIIQSSINTIAATKSAKTVYNASGFLSAVLGHFYPDFHYKVTLPKRKHIPKNLPTAEEIIAAVRGSNVELAVLLSLWLSLRMSETRGLKKADITKDGHIIISRVRLYVDSQNIVKEIAKTERSNRKLRVPDYILKLMKAIPDEQEFLVPEVPSTIENRFYRQLEKAGIPFMRFHDLRHANASTMTALGVADIYQQERGGWSSTNILKSVYQHTFSAQRKIEDEKIDSYFNDIIGKIDSMNTQ